MSSLQLACAMAIVLLVIIFFKIGELEALSVDDPEEDE
jgi:hypothetical protein